MCVLCVRVRVCARACVSVFVCVDVFVFVFVCADSCLGCVQVIKPVEQYIGKRVFVCADSGLGCVCR